jgi:DNA polymerase
MDEEIRTELLDLAGQVRNYLNYMSDLGVERLPIVQRPAPVDPIPKTTPQPTPPAISDNPETLEEIRLDLGDCTRCPLCRSRSHIVFGEGPPDARLMFVGQGPAGDEDAAGHPFMGAPGQLLTDIIVKGMKRRREDCYLAGIVKCRPPADRVPEPIEAKTCLPFLDRQIRSIRPAAIVAFGRITARHLLDTDAPWSRLRGKFHDRRGIPVMPTHDPGDLLKYPTLKRETWEDVKLLMALLDGK